jgi:class 3 adenylate cyclase
MAKTVRRSWVWNFSQPPQAIWPILADTPHLNEAVGVPKYELEEAIRPDGSVVRLARAGYHHVMLGRLLLEWDEQPYQWVAGRSARQERRFHRGPLRRLGQTIELLPDDAGGTRAIFVLEAEPATWAGRLLLTLGFLDRGGRAMERAARELAAAGAAGQPQFTGRPQIAGRPGSAETVDPGRMQRVNSMVATIEASGNGHGLARRLADLVLTGPETDLARVRPLALARSWAVPPRHAVEACLAAVKTGLLAMNWDILCPRCRGAKAAVASLDRLPRGVHCPSCNVPYDADFSRNVELTFHPAEAVRTVPPGGFCLSGPGLTPHVAVQQTLAAGERRAVAADLAQGIWRLRTLEPGSGTDIDGPEPGEGLPTVLGDGRAVVPGPPAPAGHVVLENHADHPLTFIVEDRHWLSDALTAHHVTTLEAFRELFSDAVLRPGDEVAIGHVTLLFTDLKASTALYGRVGDARAYQLVRDHFAFLAEQVRLHDGGIVKTIGDAVMAAFHDPERAVAAAIAVQSKIARFNAGRVADQALVIKLGLHGGPCVAVTLNGRLDYFGSTVNLAARLQGQSLGGDLVLSEALAADPGVAARLTTLGPVAEQARVKGFAEPVNFLRVPSTAFA